MIGRTAPLRFENNAILVRVPSHAILLRKGCHHQRRRHLAFMHAFSFSSLIPTVNQSYSLTSLQLYTDEYIYLATRIRDENIYHMMMCDGTRSVTPQPHRAGVKVAAPRTLRERRRGDTQAAGLLVDAAIGQG